MKIEISNLSKCYKSKTKVTQALNQINLNFDNGEIACILGHNGAGKTTLIKSICGLLKPENGSVKIDSKIVHENLSYAHAKCGTVLEGSRNIYYYLSAYENLRYFGLLNGLRQKEMEQLIEHYLNLFELESFRNVPANSFSRGMQQKLAIIIALMKEPDILLLDEPTLGLDIISADSVIRILKELASKRDITILITTHDINLIEQLNCRLIFMNHGEVILDSDLMNLKNKQEKSRFKIIFSTTDSETYLPEDAEIIEQQDKIVIFETYDYKWIEQHISSEDLIQIEKCSQSVIEIYKGVMNKNE